MLADDARDQGRVEIRRVACIGDPVYTPVSPTFPLELSRALREFSPDLLHLHLPNPSCFCVLASVRARRLPWIVHWHSDIPPDAPDWRLRVGYRAYRPFEQALLKRARAVVTTSQSYLDSSTALAPWRAKARVIPLGADDVELSPPRADLWPPGDGLRLLAVGRLSHYKGFDVLIRALARASEARLLLVGDGECAGDLRDAATEQGTAARIRFAGTLDDETLLAAYATADVLVLPSLNRGEAFGLVLLEAMRARLAVIASAIHGSGIGEVVVDGKPECSPRPATPMRWPQRSSACVTRAAPPHGRERPSTLGRALHAGTIGRALACAVRRAAR